ncbi:unnamed protein product [Urochloa humidicola]
MRSCGGSSPRSGGESDKKSMISVLLSLQKSEPEVLKHVHCGDGDHGEHGGMGDVAAAEPPGGSEESAVRGELPSGRPRRRAAPRLAPAHRHRDPPPPLPGVADADPARVHRGLHGRRPPRAPRHHAAGKRVRHPQGPRGVGCGQTRPRSTLPRALPLEAMCRPRQATLDVLQKL